MWTNSNTTNLVVFLVGPHRGRFAPLFFQAVFAETPPKSQRESPHNRRSGDRPGTIAVLLVESFAETSPKSQQKSQQNNLPTVPLPGAVGTVGRWFC